MELRIFTEPQNGASYEQLLEVARTAEVAGFDGFFRSDHYLRIGAGDPGPGPTDAWTTLAGIARETTVIRIGTLMTAATFRLPGPLAVTVAEVDAMSAGRVELGIGAGWFVEEHRAFGIPFPAVADRFERLEEQLEIITGIWAASDKEPFSFEGHHYRIESNIGLPKPFQSPRPPIIVGGHGHRQTPRLAARFADECNVPFGSPEDSRAVFDAVDRACEDAGRDPSTVKRSVAQVVCCAEEDADLARRARAIGREVQALKEHGVAGTPSEVLDRLASFSRIGVSRIYLQFLDLADLEHLQLIASDVLGAAGAI